MYELPTYICIGDKEYHICKNGDFRMVLDCLACLGDTQLEPSLRMYCSLLIFYDDFQDFDELNEEFGDNLVTAVEEMYKFFDCGDKAIGAEKPYKLVDWDKDSNIIISAINKVAGKEVRLDPFCHWWTFMAYYMAIGDSTLAHVVGIREKIVKGTKLEKHEKEFKAENPQFFDWNFRKEEDQAEYDRIMKMWENGGRS